MLKVERNMMSTSISTGSDVVSMCIVPVTVRRKDTSKNFKKILFRRVLAKGHS